jgi:putative ABC transport system permease protein
MIQNYLTLTVRNLRKRKVYSFINISGLAIGIAVCLVIWKYIEFELSYDRTHKHAENIYRATFTEYGKNWKDDWFAEFGYGLGPALINEIPEIKNFVRLHPLYGDVALISFDNPRGEPSVFREQNIYFVDSSFLDVFTYDITRGDASNALDKPSSMVITEAVATRYFGEHVDPIGRTLHVQTKDWSSGDFTVTAVIKEVPQNSHLQFDILFSMHNLLKTKYYRETEAAWSATNFITYLEMSANTDVKSLDVKTKRFMDKHAGTEPLGVKLSYQPLREVSLSPDLNNANGHLNILYFFLVISIFILAIAWINYINLSTARAIERAKEVGVKRAMGVSKNQLISQFIFESLLVNFVGVMLAFGLAILLLPILSNIVNKNIIFDFSNPMLWITLFGLFLIGTLVSGAYPAFVLSSFKTTEVIRGIAKTGRGLNLRKGLVVFQFTASLLLIACTFIIYRQVDFMLKRDKGLSMDRMLIVAGPQIIGEEGNQRMISFKNELLKISSVKSVTSSGAIPGGGFSFTTGMEKVGAENEKDIGVPIHVVWVDMDFIETYGMQIISGELWNPASASDLKSVFINETAVERFGLGNADQALNEKLIIGAGGEPFHIQGVVKNFNWNSLKSGYVPMLFKPQEINNNLFSIQLHSNIHESIAQVEHLYKQFFPGNPFDYYFLDDFFNSQYKAEKQFRNIFTMFSILAIVIACLGLWGLASFTIAQRVKEISIRKVLGATVSSIMSLLSSQFLKLFFISGLIALPVAWYAGNSWINNFAFRINMTVDLFIVPLVFLLVIALGTMSFQIFRGASTNPAEVLRSE